MINIEVKFDQRALKNEMVRVAVEALKEDLTKSIGGMKCPTHGKSPSVSIEGRSLDKLKISVSGCCQAFVDKVEEQL